MPTTIANGPVMAEANHGSGKDCSTEPSHPSITGTACRDWVQETIAATEKDTRRQPWKKTFANPVDSGFDDSEDLVRLVKGNGGVPDLSCPFQIQGSSLAA